ncbi:MAG: ExeA family protein [Methylococcaceae bacterium]
MYQQFFNFNTTPFSIAPDPHFIYMSERHQEGLAHLLYGINHGGGFVALTGEVGTGKTTLCHCLIKELPGNIDIALIFNPKLNAIELLATICDELQISYDQSKETLKSLVDPLNKHLLKTHAEGRRTVLLIDEAQNLSFDVLEQVRLLTNLETSTTKLLQIVLIGQPELKQILERPDLRQLNQRITARYHLTPLSYKDTQRYIKHRLKVCGGSANIFNRAAIRKVYKLSGGVPRLINILCDRALLGAYVTNTQVVTKKIIKKAAQETLNSENGLIKDLFKIASYGIFLTLALAVALYYFVPGKSPEKHIILSGFFNNPGIESKQPGLVQLKPKKEIAIPLDFNTVLKQQNSSLNNVFQQLAKLWNKETTADSDCLEIKKTGLRCLLGESNWGNLITLDRPVIMEFSIADGNEHYLLLVGIKEGNPVFSIDTKTAFPIAQVLAVWKGVYMMLWQPPVLNIENVSSGQSSDAVLWIRKQLAFNPKHKLTNLNTIFFDDELKSEVQRFQQQQQLIMDGIVGPKTFIHLSNNNLQNNSPKLKLDQ